MEIVLGWFLFGWMGLVLVAENTATPMPRVDPEAPPVLVATANASGSVWFRRIDGEHRWVDAEGPLCRPWCDMGGSFKNGVLRTLIPWPIRRGHYYQCPREGDRDYCTGDVYRDGRWRATQLVIIRERESAPGVQAEDMVLSGEIDTSKL